MINRLVYKRDYDTLCESVVIFHKEVAALYSYHIGYEQSFVQVQAWRTFQVSLLPPSSSDPSIQQRDFKIISFGLGRF